MKTVDFVIRENLPNVNQDLESVWIAVRTWHVTPWMVPPARLQQNNWSPGPNIAATPGPTLGMVSSESVKADKWARKHELSMQSGLIICWVFQVS